MLKINNTKLKKYRIPLIFSIVGIGGIFLFQYLTFTSEYGLAETKIETISPITPVNKWDDLKYMQQMTPQACQDGPESTEDTNNTTQKQLIDARDGKSYWVAKIKNANNDTYGCWMTQNLAIDLTGRVLTRNDSDVDSDWSGTSEWNTTSSTIAWQISSLGSGHNSYGGYYTFQTATVETAQIGITEAPSSICPKGWKLPSTNPDNTPIFGPWKDMLDAPRYFALSGYIENGDISGASTSGQYWTSTAATLNDDYNANLFISSNGMATGIYPIARYRGASIRCVVPITTSTTPTPIDPEGIASPTLSVTIPNIITLSIDSEVVDIDTSVSNPAEGGFTATVTSNSKYNLALSATAPEGQTPHTDLKNEDPNKTTSIPALSSTNPIITEADESWWGIKCTNPTDSTNCTKTAYTGLTLNPDTYFTSTSGTPTTGTPTPFTIGIKVSPNLPSGTYSTSIQVTASSTGSN